MKTKLKENSQEQKRSRSQRWCRLRTVDRVSYVLGRFTAVAGVPGVAIPAVEARVVAPILVVVLLIVAAPVPVPIAAETAAEGTEERLAIADWKDRLRLSLTGRT